MEPDIDPAWTRRQVLKYAAGLAAGAALPWAQTRAADEPAADKPTDAGLAGRRPNIILVMTDDQGYGDLACHGHPFVKTPHLDRLHAASTRFTDFHVSPTCAPTRAALMSGMLPFRVGITHTVLERERLSLDAVTLAEQLKKAGYATGIFGKWHLGDQDPYQPSNRGFDETFIHGAGGIGQSFAGSCADAPHNKYVDPVIRHNNRFVKTSGFCTDVFFRQALGWVRQVKDRPFFAYIPTNAPHSPYIAPERYAQMYREQTGKGVAEFFGMISNIDDNIGQLMNRLDAWGLADDTLLIFMTDNGTARGSSAGMKGQKGSVNEGGTRVPLFCRWPGRLKAGADVDRLTRHVDLFPTLAEIAGAELPKAPLDGRSLLPLLRDPKGDWPDRFTFFHRGRWQRGANPDDHKYNGFAVRNERWRLVGEKQARELYDVQQDPGEQNNVIADHADVERAMLTAYDAWWAEVRPRMVNEQAELTGPKPFHVEYEKQNAAGGIPAWERPPLDA